MKRMMVLGLGTVALVLAGLALGPRGVRADEKDEDGQNVHRRVRIVHVGGNTFLGVGLDDVEGDARGAKVRSVEDDSAAAKAGIEKGDVIVRFDGVAVRSASQLARLVRETPAGRSVPIEVTRDGATRKLTATLGERRGDLMAHDFGVPDFDLRVPEPPLPPEAPAPPAPPAFHWRDDGGGMRFHLLPGQPRKLGIQYMEMGGQLAGYFKVAGGKGVLVTSVEDDGPAAKAGLKAGDVVLEVGGKKVEDGEDLRHVVDDLEGGQEVTVTVQRDGRPLDLKVKVAGPETKEPHAAGVTL
jgi:serine protease Do